MNLAEIEVLESKATDQTGKFLATTIPLTPGTLLDLCRLARIGIEHESTEGKPS